MAAMRNGLLIKPKGTLGGSGSSFTGRCSYQENWRASQSAGCTFRENKNEIGHDLLARLTLQTDFYFFSNAEVTPLLPLLILPVLSMPWPDFTTGARAWRDRVRLLVNALVTSRGSRQ